MKISIVIPNYNGKHLLEKNLPSVIQAIEYYTIKEKAPGEIIIVDDCSEDDSVLFVTNEINKLKERIPIKLFNNDHNRGFSTTVNRGVYEANGDIVVLINTDVIPEKEFLVPLLKHFINEKVFAVGCMDKSLEGDKVVFRGRGIGKWSRGFLIHNRGEINKSNTLWASGGSSAFRKSIWDKLGGLQELYNPFYWEDIDMSYRALKSDYQIVFEPESIVTHKHAEGIIKRKYSPSAIKKIAYRNQFMFVWLNVTDLDLRLSHILWLPYHFFKAIIRGDSAFWAGFFYAFIRIPKIVQSNFQTQKLFKKKDREIFPEFIT